MMMSKDIANCQLPIANLKFSQHFRNRQSAIGNPQSAIGKN